MLPFLRPCGGKRHPSCVPLVLSSLRWKAAKPSGKRPEVERGMPSGRACRFLERAVPLHSKVYRNYLIFKLISWRFQKLFLSLQRDNLKVKEEYMYDNKTA